MLSDKALVEILVPASGKSFDVYIPLDAKMHDVNKLVCATLSKLSQGLFIADENTILCNKDTGIIYNANLTVSELDIKNGTKLMLI